MRYRTILNGSLNYYSFTNNKPSLILIYWILRKSLAKTLATKLKLKTARKVYLKFGINIKYRVPGTDIVLRNLLGSGNFGDVYLGSWNNMPSTFQLEDFQFEDFEFENFQIKTFNGNLWL